MAFKQRSENPKPNENDNGQPQRTEKSLHEANRTVGVSLNVDNEYRYNFTVEVPPIVLKGEASELKGVNVGGKKFKLGSLGNVLMRLLEQFDHATKKFKMDDYYYVDGYWKIHAPPEKQRKAALFARVRPSKVCDGHSEAAKPKACARAGRDVDIVERKKLDSDDNTGKCDGNGDMNDEAESDRLDVLSERLDKPISKLIVDNSAEDFSGKRESHFCG